MATCGRCGVEITDEQPEICWWCEADLCDDCWEDYGHCGHPEADQANEAARRSPAWGRQAFCAWCRNQERRPVACFIRPDCDRVEKGAEKAAEMLRAADVPDALIPY